MSESGLRDEVIASLRERGWPEPVLGDDGAFIGLAPCWQGSDGAQVEWLVESAHIEYAPDNFESGDIYFFEPPASRIIDAIDRLRWVIGLPFDEALLAMEEFGQAAFPAKAIIGKVVPSDQGKMEFSPYEAVRPTGSVRSLWVIPCLECGAISGENAAAVVQADPDGDRTPMPPSKPAPKVDPPYVPRKIGEF